MPVLHYRTSAVAIGCAREGADVALSYLPEEEADAERVANVVEVAGRKLIKLTGQVRTARYCKELVDKAVEALGGLDILVNNAIVLDPAAGILRPAQGRRYPSSGRRLVLHSS